MMNFLETKTRRKRYEACDELPCVDGKDAARNGAPHSRVALFRSASVLLQKKTLAEKEPFG